MSTLKHILYVDYDSWVNHNDPRAHKSKKCLTCFMESKK